jgi:hypothetical protein
MSVKTALAATVFALAASTASAASLDLAARGLVQGALIAQTDDANVFFDLTGGSLVIDGDDGSTSGFLTVFLGPPFDTLLELFPSPNGLNFFTGTLVEYDSDPMHAVGLFYDAGAMRYVLAEATAPTGAAFDLSGDLILSGVSAAVYNVAPIPLPAPAGLLVAGLASIAGLRAARRRNKGCMRAS